MKLEIGIIQLILLSWIIGFNQSLWMTDDENKNRICRDNRMVSNIRSQLICQKQCEEYDNCIGTSYPKFNGYTKDCYLCFSRDFMTVPEYLIEAEMEFKIRPKGIFIS